ncbi:MAG: hypothetical protein WDO56_02950 [Gammaproteobacteria bacterium]
MSLATYGTRHAQAIIGALGRLARNPLATVLTLLRHCGALALPMSLKLLVTNARAATGDFKNAVDLSVYLKTGTALTQAEQLAKNARARNGVADVELIPADKALESSALIRASALRWKCWSRIATARSACFIRLPTQAHRRRSNSSSSLRRVAGSGAGADRLGVGDAVNAILDVMRKVLLIVAALLGLGVLAVVGNTIRLEILNRRAEIEITKLVGGSNRFVRRPFLYTGALYGLGGRDARVGCDRHHGAGAVEPGGDACATLWEPLRAGAGPRLEDTAIVLGGGAVLGWLGAWISGQPSSEKHRATGLTAR